MWATMMITHCNEIAIQLLELYLAIINHSRRILMKDTRKKSITSVLRSTWTHFGIFAIYRNELSWRERYFVVGLDNVIGNMLANIPEGNTRSSIRRQYTRTLSCTIECSRQIEVFVSAYLSRRHSPITGIRAALESSINTPWHLLLYCFTIGWVRLGKIHEGFVVRDFSFASRRPHTYR